MRKWNRQGKQTGIHMNFLLISCLKNLPASRASIFHPYRTPYFDVSVKGAILGLDLSTTREEIMKALLEGVAFEIKLNLDILKESGYEVKELRVIGGGARSRDMFSLKQM